MLLLISFGGSHVLMFFVEWFGLPRRKYGFVLGKIRHNGSWRRRF